VKHCVRCETLVKGTSHLVLVKYLLTGNIGLIDRQTDRIVMCKGEDFSIRKGGIKYKRR
jgi:hypothetical protein